MDDIKSAAEIAAEKVRALGEASDEERMRWKYVPEGEKLAARYLREDYNLVAELSKYEKNITEYVKEGATEILVRNIFLPKDSQTEKNNRRAMDSLKVLKSNRVGVENIYSKIRRVFSHYKEQGEQQKRQAYESLKVDFQSKLQQALQQQLGPVTGMKIDVEAQPQFQEEWRKVQTQLDSQYLQLLNEYKQELLTVP
jgi:hypothetical protein